MKAEVMELPLFPLNVVLFPGQTLPLHIFEPRYRTMIQRCIEQGQPFGVVLAQDEDDRIPHPIGTAARITQVERLADGCMNILTVGVERFILQNIHEGEDEYLIGDALFYPYKDEDEPATALTQQVTARLRRYLTLLSSMSGTKYRFEHFPRDPAAIGVFTAIALQLPLEAKQELLVTESVNELLAREADILKDELLALTIIAMSIHPADESESIIFSRN